MKKYLSILVLMLMGLCVMPLTSCSSDDDDDNNGTSQNSELVGTWKGTDSWTAEMGMVDYIQFKADGVYVNINVYEGMPDVSYGTWERSGNKLKTTENGMSTTSTIKKLTGSELVLNNVIDMSYKKVSDSEVEKYLR